MSENYRRDDFPDMIAKIESKGSVRKPKINQTWRGEVLVPLVDSQISILEALNAVQSDRWKIFLRAKKEGLWAIFGAQYTAKGANADDAEQKFAKIFDIKDSNTIGVRTETVSPVGD